MNARIGDLQKNSDLHSTLRMYNVSTGRISRNCPRVGQQEKHTKVSTSRSCKPQAPSKSEALRDKCPAHRYESSATITTSSVTKGVESAAYAFLDHKASREHKPGARNRDRKRRDRLREIVFGYCTNCVRVYSPLLMVWRRVASGLATVDGRSGWPARKTL